MLWVLLLLGWGRLLMVVICGGFKVVVGWELDGEGGRWEDGKDKDG